ncbi:MAG: TetR family transcriptional regulator [Bdellovibrionota bacterium]
MHSDLQLAELYQDILDFKPRQKDLRTVQVISAVIDLIAEEGIDEVTFESVGKRVGMARSHVVYYFKDRNEMIRQAVRFVGHSAQRIISEDLVGIADWEPLLKAYVNANFNWLEQYPRHAAVMLLLYYLASYSKKERDFHSQLRETGRRRLEAILALSPPLKKLSLARRRAMARALQGVVTGALLDAFTTRELDLSTAKKETVQVVLEIVAGFVGRGSRRTCTDGVPSIASGASL